MNISAEKAWQNGRNSTGTFYAPALHIKRQEDLQEDITYQVGGGRNNNKDEMLEIFQCNHFIDGGAANMSTTSLFSPGRGL